MSRTRVVVAPLGVLLLSMLLFPAVALAQSAPDTLYRTNRSYRLQTDLFSLYGTHAADIVMLGNSITFGVHWTELMGRTGIVNRGIGGDVTAGFLARIESILMLRPKLCCVMGGINDLSQDIPVDTVAARYTQVLERLRAAGITPIIQSTLFAAPPWTRWTEKNPEVRRLNSLLRLYADSGRVEFLDLNAVLAPAMVLKEEYTYDGIHLTAAGYRVWRDMLDPVLRRHGL